MAALARIAANIPSSRPGSHPCTRYHRPWTYSHTAPLQIEVDELLEVCTHNLVSVDKDDLVEVHGEEDIEEENLVWPDDLSLFTLLA